MRAFFGLFQFLMEEAEFWLARFEGRGSRRKHPLPKVEAGLWAEDFALQLSVFMSRE
jgi:hypothetical protein